MEVVKTGTFDRWLTDLRDKRARARILIRLERLALGNPGDVKVVGDGVSELRIDYGPGYRIYFIQDGPVLIVVLAGGDKTSQITDIKKARSLAAKWRK
jgi:putative addiction module killer protein